LLYRESEARLGADAVFMDYESVPLGHDFEPVLLRSVCSSPVQHLRPRASRQPG
jgi:hypothetical protein